MIYYIYRYNTINNYRYVIQQQFTPVHNAFIPPYPLYMVVVLVPTNGSADFQKQVLGLHFQS